MTIAYPATPFSNPNSCEHWLLTATLTTADETSISVQTPVARGAYSSADPESATALGVDLTTLRGLAQYVIYLESRRLGKAAGATTLAQLNSAVRNQTVVL